MSEASPNGVKQTNCQNGTSRKFLDDKIYSILPNILNLNVIAMLLCKNSKKMKRSWEGKEKRSLLSGDPVCFSCCQETLDTSDKVKITTEKISRNVKENNE